VLRHFASSRDDHAFAAMRLVAETSADRAFVRDPSGSVARRDPALHVAVRELLSQLADAPSAAVAQALGDAVEGWSEDAPRALLRALDRTRSAAIARALVGAIDGAGRERMGDARIVRASLRRARARLHDRALAREIDDTLGDYADSDRIAGHIGRPRGNELTRVVGHASDARCAEARTRLRPHLELLGRAF
jgi:hypothetical protein